MNRDKLIALLKKLEHPHQRFGQTIFNMIANKHGRKGFEHTMFFMGDGEFADLLISYLKEHTRDEV